MAEKHSKSKLKRNKSSVKDLQADICSRGTLKRSHTTLFSSEITAETVRSVAPAAVWWNSEQLPAVESLWALTLKSALPYLENQHWDLVPELPHPSTARPSALQSDEQHWCDLSEVVTPLPEPSTPSRGLPLRLNFYQQELSVQTTPGPDSPDRQLSSHSRQRHNDKTSLQAITKRPLLSLYGSEGPASSAGPLSVGGDEGRNGAEQEEETGTGNRLLHQVKVSDGQVCLQREGKTKEEVVEDKEEEEVQRSVSGDGEAAGWLGLQSCPMCLLVFPVGFTQMDCDGHLAQCLMEVNVDVTW